MISRLTREKKELIQEKYGLESKLRSQMSQQNSQRRESSLCNVCHCNSTPGGERSSFGSPNSKVRKLCRIV